MTREQLVEALRGSRRVTALARAPDPPVTEYTKCAFVPVRANQKACTEGPPYNEVGFCRKHAKTLQSTRALEERLAAKGGTEEPVPVPRPTRRAPPVEEEEEPAPKPRGKTPKAAAPAPAPAPTRRKPKVPEPEESDESEEVEEKTPPPKPKKLAKVQTVKVIQNSWGRYEEPETHFVFDAQTRLVYGVQLKNGKVRPLTEKDIAICDQRSWGYALVDEGDETEASEEEESGEEEGESSGDGEVVEEGEGEGEEEEGSDEEEEEVTSD